MKRHFYITSLAIALCLMGYLYGNNRNTSLTMVNNVVSNNTASATNESSNYKEYNHKVHIPKESAIFTSHDLKWAWAQGHIKSIIETHYNHESSNSYKIIYRFNIQGNLTSIYNEQSEEFSIIERDKSGRIHTIQNGDDYALTETTIYTYNSSGNVIKAKENWFQGRSELTYELNYQGWPNKKKCEMFESFGQYYYNTTYKTTYQYNTIDSHGNWTSCTLKEILTDYDTNDPEADFIKYENKTIIRSIEY